MVAARVDIAASYWARFMGLMFRESLEQGCGLVLSPCNSIHMFFMRFPIDAAFVDDDGRVVRAIDSIKPWRMTSFVRGAKSVIELPAGTLRGAGVNKGELLTLHPLEG